MTGESGTGQTERALWPRSGTSAVPLSGSVRVGGVRVRAWWVATQMVEKDIGFVGEVTRVDPTVLRVSRLTHTFAQPERAVARRAPPKAREKRCGCGSMALECDLAPVFAACAPACAQIAVENGYTPVVATIATDDKGQALNINADTAAGEVRAALVSLRLQADARAQRTPPPVVQEWTLGRCCCFCSCLSRVRLPLRSRLRSWCS